MQPSAQHWFALGLISGRNIRVHCRTCSYRQNACTGRGRISAQWRSEKWKGELYLNGLDLWALLHVYIMYVCGNVPGFSELSRVKWNEICTTAKWNDITFGKCTINRLQWPRALMHEMFSPARTLVSSVRILLEVCMSVCVYSMYAFSCIYVMVLRQADPYPKSPADCV
jgi:hypothetical protein